jgi:hypothetical protein
MWLDEKAQGRFMDGFSDYFEKFGAVILAAGACTLVSSALHWTEKTDGLVFLGGCIAFACRRPLIRGLRALGRGVKALWRSRLVWAALASLSLAVGVVPLALLFGFVCLFRCLDRRTKVETKPASDPPDNPTNR